MQQFFDSFKDYIIGGLAFAYGAIIWAFNKSFVSKTDFENYKKTQKEEEHKQYTEILNKLHELEILIISQGKKEKE